MAKGNRQSVRDSAHLDVRLSEYDATARTSNSVTALRRRTGSWPVYAAATGSALAMATGASASVITSGIVSGTFQNVSVNPIGPTYTHLGLHLAGPSVKIQALSGVSTNGPFAALELQPGANVNIIFSGASDIAKNFALGDPIQGNAGPNGDIVKAFFSGVDYGNFVSGQPGFAGLSFTTASGNMDYGWIELKFTTKNGLPYNLEALAFGINTNPGQHAGDLAAGQVNGASTPEPGTLSLALLASGAAGVTALRRRRKQQADSNAV